jgi:hypothetical protein
VVLSARRERASATLAAVVLERLLDIVAGVLLFGPVALVGIVWMARDGLTLRSAVRLASSSGLASLSDTESVGVSNTEAGGPMPSRVETVTAKLSRTN